MEQEGISKEIADHEPGDITYAARGTEQQQTCSRK